MRQSACTCLSKAETRLPQNANVSDSLMDRAVLNEANLK